MFGNAVTYSGSAERACYGGIAPFYDDMYIWRDGVDREFFLSQATRPGMRILELGCGTGRISLPLARLGHSVTALDLSPAMLEHLNAKLLGETADVRERMRLVQADMSRFDAGGGFELVLIPFRAFMHLLTREAQRGCLDCVRGQLAPGGRLVFDLFDPNFAKIGEYASLPRSFMQDLEQELADGARLRRYTRIVARPGEQVNDIEMRFERIDASGRVIANGEEAFAMRWTTHAEMLLLLELCGLEAEAVFSSYDGAALEERSGELIYRCRQAGGAR